MEWQETLDIWRSEFKNFINKVNAINEEWASVPFFVDMLTQEEQSLLFEEYNLDLLEIETCYDFRREIQNLISS